MSYSQFTDTLVHTHGTLKADRQGAAGTQNGSVLKKLSEGRLQLGYASQWYPSIKGLGEKSRHDTLIILCSYGRKEPTSGCCGCCPRAALSTCPCHSIAPQPKSQIIMGWKPQVLSNNFSSFLCFSLFASVLLPKLRFPPCRQKLLDI